MKIDADLVKKLRINKPWSQEQLSDASGLNLRTIQRLESTGKASIESIQALANAFEIDPHELTVAEKDKPMTPFTAFITGVVEFTNFSDTATRFEYWWFLLFVLLILAVASIINEQILQIVSVIVLLPLIAAGTRRLQDAGQSGWWQLLFLVPFGFVVVFCMLALESKTDTTYPI